jgi:hypothetical protein
MMAVKLVSEKLLQTSLPITTLIITTPHDKAGLLSAFCKEHDFKKITGRLDFKTADAILEGNRGRLKISIGTKALFQKTMLLTPLI